MRRPWREPPLTFSEHDHDGVRVIAVRGELDLASAPQLVARLDTQRNGGRRARVLVDLTGLAFCDSSGLRALIRAAGEVRSAGGRLAVCVGDGPVARLLEITGAGEWLHLHPDAADGVAALARR
jgi:anti-sigma B factor antagonist